MKVYNLTEEFFPSTSVIINRNKISVIGFDGNIMYEEKSTINDMIDDEREWISKIGEFVYDNQFLIDINKGLGLK